MQIHKLTIFLLLTTTQLIKSTEPTDNIYLFYTNSYIKFIDQKKDINPNIQKLFIFYLTGKYYDKNISINCNNNKYYKLKNKNTNINTTNDTININLQDKTCKITNKDKTTNIDIKDYPIIIFEVKKKKSDKNSKFIYYIDSNTDNIKNTEKNETTNYGLFGNIGNIYDMQEHSDSFEMIKIKKVFNIQKWQNIDSICAGNRIIKTFDFGEEPLQIKNASQAFFRSNIKELKNMPNLFTKYLENVRRFFYDSKIEKADLSDLTLPSNCNRMFGSALKLKEITLNNTDLTRTTDLRGFVVSTDIEELDFSKTKNDPKTEKKINSLVNYCKNLKTIKFGTLINEHTKDYCPFLDNNSLKTIDLSDAKINKNMHLFYIDLLKTKKNIILPNDEQSAINCLKNIDEINWRYFDLNDPHTDVTYQGGKIKNFDHFDDISKFISDPDSYKKDRNTILKENTTQYFVTLPQITKRLKESNNKQETLNEILKTHKLFPTIIKDLKKEVSGNDTTEEPDQQNKKNNRKKRKFGKSNNNSCCKQCCCCCCK